MQGSYSKAYLQPSYWEACGEGCYFRQRKILGRKAGCCDRLGIYSPSPPKGERHSNDLPIATILFREFLASTGVTSGIISIARRKRTILCHCAGILHPCPQDTSTPLNTEVFHSSCPDQPPSHHFNPSFARHFSPIKVPLPNWYHPNVNSPPYCRGQSREFFRGEPSLDLIP